MLTFIVNPAAGNGNALKWEKSIREHLEARKIEARFLHTEAPHHATTLAAEAAQDPACTGVVAVGGDGTSL